MLCTPPPSPQVVAAQASCHLAPFRSAIPEQFDMAEDDRRSGLGTSEEMPLSDPLNVESAARVAAAREARLALVGTADSYFRGKVELLRCSEEHQTERCRVTSEARTKQVERLAGAAEILVAERHRTLRNRDTLRAQAMQAAIATSAQIETRRIETRAGMVNFFQWMAASLIGVAGATAANPRRKQAQRVGLARYASAMIVVAIVRHMWLNSVSREFICGLGPFFRSIFCRMIQGSLETILQYQRAVHCAQVARKAGHTTQRLALEGLVVPDIAPSSWVSQKGPDGRTFWHHKSLGPAPWELRSTDHGSEAIGALSSKQAPNQGAGDQFERMQALLSTWGLAEYAQALNENGYDPQVLMDLREDEFEELLHVIDCKPAHAAIFRAAFASLEEAKTSACQHNVDSS